MTRNPKVKRVDRRCRHDSIVFRERWQMNPLELLSVESAKCDDCDKKFPAMVEQRNEILPPRRGKK
jgi:hypothetical protein